MKNKKMKICSLNAEWMVHLFKRQKAEFWIGKSQNSGIGSKPKNVQKVCEKIAGVIKEISPDIQGILEGPPLKEQMELFVNEYLDSRYKVYSMPDEDQSIHVLVKKNVNGLTIKQVPEEHDVYKYLSRKIEYYTWDTVEKVRLEKFTRKPVVLSLVSADGDKIELITFHTKSKISKLKNPREWEERDKDKIVDAIRSRQKLSAEMAVVRRYLTHAILSRRVKGCILMGDLNDGPNRDIFEEYFLIHNIVDELRGGFHREHALMHHVLTQEYLNSKDAFSSDFNDPTKSGKKIRELLDHILVSDFLIREQSSFIVNHNLSKIEHEIFEKYLDNEGKTRDDRPSDHRPITTVIEY